MLKTMKKAPRLTAGPGRPAVKEALKVLLDQEALSGQAR